MIRELGTLLGSVSVFAFLVALATGALGLRRQAIRRNLGWAEALSQWWTELSAWSLAVGSGSGAPNPRTSRVGRAFLVLVWVATVFLVPYQAQPVSAQGGLGYHEDGHNDFDLSDPSNIPPTTNGAESPTLTEAPFVYTDEDGRYRFESVPKGIHKVTIDLSTLPLHLRPPEGEVSPALWLTPGMEQTSEAISTGVRFTAAYDRMSGDISGFVFLDLDGDGRPGPNDPGLPGVRVIDPTVYQYYVPFNDVNLWTLFDDKNTGLPGAQQCHGGTAVSGDLVSSIFLVASADGTVYYYDHWEDGYDADPLVPGPTTESGVLNAGDVQPFQDNIDPALVPDTTVFFYDGRDRITVAGLVGVSVVRQVYPENPGELLAGAWEVPEVSDWGTSFVATVGEDLDFNGGAVDDHDFTGLEVMAGLPGTEVYYNGTLVATLGAGGTVFIDGANDGPGGGGVDSTDTITATAPIQLQMLTGGCGRPFSAHGYTLLPLRDWGNEYWAPVPGFSCAGNAADSDIYIHNHNVGPITVTAASDQGSVDVLIPAHTTISLLDYVTDPIYGINWVDISTGPWGIHLSSADPFRAMAVIDSSSNGLHESQDYDWGYCLVPEPRLSSQVVIGYGPGNSARTDNGSSAFVTAIADTVLYVDLDQDGTPDPFDMDGDGDANDNDVFGIPVWDEPVSAGGIPLLAGQTTRVGDPFDHDLEGALIYTSDYEDKIAVAWGQDPCRAGTAYPYLDLGYTILPLAVASLSKTDDLAIDADQTGDVTPGDTITYTLVLVNAGLGSMNNVILTDSLPYTYTDFVVGSIQVTTPPPHDPIEYSDDGTTFGVLPHPGIQAFRIQWPTIDSRQVVTITFLVMLHTDIPPTVTEVTNRADVASSNVWPPIPSVDPDDPFDPDTDTPVAHPPVVLHLDKRVSPSGVVSPGGTLTYTLCYSNSGSVAATNAVITDFIPLNTTYINGSATAPNGETLEYHDGTFWTVVEPPASQVEGLRWLTATLAPRATYCVQFGVQVNMTTVGSGVTNTAAIDSIETDPIYDTVYNPFPGLVPTPEPSEPEPSEPEPAPTSTPTPTSIPIPVQPASVTPTPTVEILAVAKLPETGGSPDWLIAVLGVPILIGAIGLLNLALLGMKGRCGDRKRD